MVAYESKNLLTARIAVPKDATEEVKVAIDDSIREYGEFGGEKRELFHQDANDARLTIPPLPYNNSGWDIVTERITVNPGENTRQLAEKRIQALSETIAKQFGGKVVEARAQFNPLGKQVPSIEHTREAAQNGIVTKAPSFFR